MRNVTTWIGRILTGFGLGWIWTSALSLFWVGLASLPDGDIIAGLDRVKSAWWAEIAFAAYFTSVIGCGVGAFLGTVLTRHRATVRLPLLKGSAIGGLVAAWPAAGFGSLAGWVTESWPLDSVFWVWVLIGVVSGIVGGGVVWLVMGRRTVAQGSPPVT